MGRVSLQYIFYQLLLGVQETNNYLQG